MLVELRIRNFAIIDELQVSFGDGLNVISGETGAGKSIIIGAISLLLGDRASMDMIRSSEDTATVEACFTIAGMEALREKLEEMGFFEGDEIVIKRTISRSGKNRVYINGSMANLAVLSSLSELLVNICGQHEHQVILNKENHIDILDDFGGLQPLKKEYEVLYAKYNFLSARLRELGDLSVRNKAEEELHKFQLKEIIDADIKAGEDGLLLEEKKVITNFQRLLEHADSGYEKLYGGQSSILEQLRLVMSNIGEIKKIDGGMKVDEQAVEAIYYQIEDVALTLRDYGKNLSFDPDRLEAVEERLELLGRLKRKYGGALEGVLKKKADLENNLQIISTLSDEMAQTEKAIGELISELKGKAYFLSQKRKETAEKLRVAIEAEIHTLRMDRASFLVNFEGPQGEDGNFTIKGIDDVEFFLSTNAGEELKPLTRIASGGELSRIVLAMKKVTAGMGSVGTIIFDEVDSGIGGATAEVVGEKLKAAAADCQVICITHLPQIACFANRHFLVSKEQGCEGTNTCIRLLSDEERLEEITRMLAGIELTAKAREHAREMLKFSTPYR